MSWSAPFPGRHVLARLNREGIGITVLPQKPSGGLLPDMVETWFSQGFPAIVRRQNGGAPPLDSSLLVPLGIPLPPCQGKWRIPLLARREEICSFELPPLLEATIGSAPSEWRPWLERTALRFSDRGLEVRVYGALLWQHLTGIPYLHPESDLDLICTLTHATEFPEAAEAFKAAEHDAVARLDGEIYFPEVGWAAWREAALTSSRSLLIKHDQGERLIERNDLFATPAGRDAWH